jgi:hypothetical protein
VLCHGRPLAAEAYLGGTPDARVRYLVCVRREARHARERGGAVRGVTA